MAEREREREREEVCKETMSDVGMWGWGDVSEVPKQKKVNEQPNQTNKQTNTNKNCQLFCLPPCFSSTTTPPPPPLHFACLTQWNAVNGGESGRDCVAGTGHQASGVTGANENGGEEEEERGAGRQATWSAQ